MKYWLSTLPEDVPLQRMVYEAKMRWRIGAPPLAPHSCA
jgi:hypothetical protein